MGFPSFDPHRAPPARYAVPGSYLQSRTPVPPASTAFCQPETRISATSLQSGTPAHPRTLLCGISPRVGCVPSSVSFESLSLGTGTGGRLPRDPVPVIPFLQQTSRGFNGLPSALRWSLHLCVAHTSYFITAARTT